MRRVVGGAVRSRSRLQSVDRGMGDVESSDEEEVGDGEGTDMTRGVERQGAEKGSMRRWRRRKST